MARPSLAAPRRQAGLVGEDDDLEPARTRQWSTTRRQKMPVPVRVQLADPRRNAGVPPLPVRRAASESGARRRHHERAVLPTAHHQSQDESTAANTTPTSSPYQVKCSNLASRRYRLGPFIVGSRVAAGCSAGSSAVRRAASDEQRPPLHPPRQPSRPSWHRRRRRGEKLRYRSLCTVPVSQPSGALLLARSVQVVVSARRGTGQDRTAGRDARVAVAASSFLRMGGGDSAGSALRPRLATARWDGICSSG